MRYYLAACAIVRNEEPYLREWLHYHHYLGVEHFYLYDNEDHPAIRANMPCATVTHWPGRAQQLLVYDHCLCLALKEARWLAFIDVDEFLVPHTTRDLRWLMSAYEDFAALLIHWRLFGSAERLSGGFGPVTCRFTRRQADVNPHIKSIVDPRRAAFALSPHHFRLLGPACEEGGGEVESAPLLEKGTADIIQLNHYATKSWDECRVRRALPRADNGAARVDVKEFFRAHDRNEVEDNRASALYKECVNEPNAIRDLM